MMHDHQALPRSASRRSALFAAAPASAQQFTMKLSLPTINDVTYEYFKPMKAGIEQRAGGKIKVEIYPANQLGQLPVVVEGVALGTIEAARPRPTASGSASSRASRCSMRPACSTASCTATRC